MRAKRAGRMMVAKCILVVAKCILVLDLSSKEMIV